VRNSNKERLREPLIPVCNSVGINGNLKPSGDGRKPGTPAAANSAQIGKSD
jgi:hypothetical protein